MTIVEDLPRTLGRYQLIELLATGGMAHIYRARLASSQGTEKELVIKQILPHLTQNRDFIDMFIDEARRYYARLVELLPDAPDIDALRNTLRVLGEEKGGAS